MTFLFSIKRFAREFPGHFIATCLTLVILSAGGVLAAQTTSYDVTNNPQMYLDVSITPTQTSGVKIAALTRNSSQFPFPTTSGGILRIRQGFRVEDISYTSATIDSSTKVATLVGVVRNICWNIANQIVTCGEGQSFSRGATVELAVDARLLNFKLNRDRTNTGTGLFSIGSSQTTQPWLFPNRVTTAQRDAFTAGTSASQSPIIFNTTTGVMEYWNGTAWIRFGSGSIINASEAVAGKVELATPTNISGSVITDDSGARLAIDTALLIRSSTGAINNRNKVVATNNRGYLSGSLLGSGEVNGSGILLGNQTYLSGTASGQFIRLNSQVKPVYTDFTPTMYDRTVFISGTSSTATGASNTNLVFADNNQYTIPASDLVAGVGYEFEFVGRHVITNTGGTDTLTVDICLGSTSVNSSTTVVFTTDTTGEFVIRGTLTGTAAAGASSEVRSGVTYNTKINATEVGAAFDQYQATNIATNTAQTLRLCATFGASHASNLIQVFSSKVRKISTTAF